MPDYYAVLDLSTSATAAQIEARYRQFLRMFDPTLYDEPAEKAYVEKKLKAVNEAYAALCYQHRAENRQQTGRSSDPASTHCHSNGSLNTPKRWLQQFGLSLLTIFVATFLGSVVLDHGLGVLAYVTHLQEDGATLISVEPPLSQFPTAFSPKPQFYERLPFYSADEQQVAYVVNTEGKKQLLLGIPNTNVERALTRSATLISLPLWSPQADKLAFLEDSDSGPVLQIFVPATNRFYSLPSSERLGQIGRFGWTSDGNSILFESRKLNSSRDITLWQVNNMGQQVERYAESAVPALIWSTPIQ